MNLIVLAFVFKFLLTSAVPRSIETLGEAILNLSGQIDLPITLETNHYLFIRLYDKYVMLSAEMSLLPSK